MLKVLYATDVCSSEAGGILPRTRDVHHVLVVTATDHVTQVGHVTDTFTIFT